MKAKIENVPVAHSPIPDTVDIANLQWKVSPSLIDMMEKNMFYF